MAKSKKFSLEEVQSVFQESDDELFEEFDDERDSNYELSDVEEGSSGEETTVNFPSAGETTTSKTVVKTATSDSRPAVHSMSAATTELIANSWRVCDSSYVPAEFPFTAKPGVHIGSLTSDSLPVDFFSYLVTEELINLLVEETNRYALQFLKTSALKEHSRARSWSPTDAVEMKKFLGIILSMGLLKKPTIADYWSTEPILATPAINKIMPRNRFDLILKFWHFSNSEEQVEGDRLHKLRDVHEALVSRFQAAYTPEKELSIDEPMVLWRGRLQFRQYIPGKRHQFGVKLYMLCEASGYAWNVLVYCGKSDAVPGLGHAEGVVMKLMEKRLDQGHCLYVDNFYTSIPLAKQLLSRATHLCGTLRRNRRQIPDSVTKSELRPGQHIARRRGTVTVMKWKDKREILMLSTHHPGNFEDSRKRTRSGSFAQKPDCVLDFNRFMCGVDRMDQLLSSYSQLRKSMKWYKKVVLQLIDIAVMNSFLLYQKTGGTRRQQWFRLQLIQALLGSQDRPEPTEPPVVKKFNKCSDLSRLGGQHFLCSIPATTKAHPSRRCVVCRKHGRRKDTRYICETCPSVPALCFEPCFKLFHTQRYI